MWTCRATDNPSVIKLIDGHAATSGRDWAEQLETLAGDAITGKVLCVCAGLAIARRCETSTMPADDQALSVLQQWIDDPTDQRFERLSAWLIDDPPSRRDPEMAPVTGWALRVATSSVGNYEAGFALAALCERAEAAGLYPV